MEEQPRQEDGEHSVSTSVDEIDSEEEEDPTQTKSQFKSSPTRPWKCPVCNWYLSTSKFAGCPYCATGAPQPSRDKEKEHPATSKQREEDRPVSQKRLVNVWNVGQSKNATIPKKGPGAVRFVCISDTHNRHENLSVPSGDVLIHSGDFTLDGATNEVEDFVDWLDSLPHKYKIVIAGNHDTTFRPEWYEEHHLRYHSESKCEAQKLKDLVASKFIYLEDSMVEIEGIRIYGSPWTLSYHDWVFQLDGGEEIKRMWDLIPTGVDVLVTHNPPSGYNKHNLPQLLQLANADDVVGAGRLHLGVGKIDAGCAELKRAVNRVKPRVHVFGHVHEGYGVLKQQPTTFINACSVNRAYKPVNKPIVFDLV